MDSAHRPSSSSCGSDAELMAGLWQQAPFPRLPWDSPAELRELVANVDNPRRVYAIHRASRRHTFQLTVQKYIVQLREGCGVSDCHNSTCFTCRKRIAGRAPLRRYNTTSARTLAIHLASQDNPEAGLCPALRLPKTAPAALRSLGFSPKYTADGPLSRDDGSSRMTKAQMGHARDRKGSGTFGATGAARKSMLAAGAGPIRDSREGRGIGLGDTKDSPDVDPKFVILEKPVSKDYRSFAANMFGTVAFKMLEWLTPAAIDSLTERAEKFQGSPLSGNDRQPSRDGSPETMSNSDGPRASEPRRGSRVAAARSSQESSEKKKTASTTSSTTRRNSNARVLTSSTLQTPSPASAPLASTPTPIAPLAPLAPLAPTPQQRTLTVDTFSAEPTPEELLSGLRSPRISSLPPDNINSRAPAAKSVKTTASSVSTQVVPRPISQLASAGYFDGVALEKMPPAAKTAATTGMRQQVAGSPRRSGSEVSLEKQQVQEQAQEKARERDQEWVQSQQRERPQSPASNANNANNANIGSKDSKAGSEEQERDRTSQASGSGSRSSRSPSSDGLSEQPSLTAAEADEQDRSLDALLPQTLTRLDADVIDFMCDVLQDDGSTETHMLEPQMVTRFHTGSERPGHVLRRRSQKPKNQKNQKAPRRPALHASLYPELRQEWGLFIEQSLFYVLSEPQALLSSFTRHGQLYDTQTLWYCMLRLTRAAPSLVLHSLWMAAETLFAPPDTLQALRPSRPSRPSRSSRPSRPSRMPLAPSSSMSSSLASSPLALPVHRLSPRARPWLDNREAGILVSICFHALVATAPLVENARQLHDMSRIRSQGVSLAVSSSVARQPPELCLQYEDAFSHGLALRLARRLLAAIMARRCFDELAEYEGGEEGEEGEEGDGREDEDETESEEKRTDKTDVLDPLFAQLDFLNMDAAYILNFSVADRTLHETRMPTLLLDWARSVMLNDWDGHAVVACDSPLGGALALTSAIFERRQALLVGDVQFRCEFFSERLDAVETPMSWLSYESTKQRQHVLDFPFLFSPEMLVSYFRAINFARMSRTYEESSSLQSRMEAIVSPGSLVVNPHHKTVLQKLLQTASARYLILDIGRSTVLQDAFDQLWRREERELLRPLKIHLGEEGGEEGFDSGGVQQEFFRLAMAEALDPSYGAFAVDSRTRMAWFHPAALEEDWKFELVGLLVSLALYNGVSLPVTFPKALYRKLLGEPVTELHHIADGWPDLANGLTALLEWNEQDGGAVEDVFVRTYEFSVDVFGQPVSRVMDARGSSWPRIREIINGGGSVASSPATATATPTPGAPAEEDEPPMVTHANRNAYVSDYIHYLTDVSVRGPFAAFARGFRACLHPKSLRLLTPTLLQSMVEGEQDIDVSELRRQARYVGWDASHRTVRDFWSIVSRYDDAMKRKLLEFVTASDRVPVGGIKNLHFIVQRNGEETGAGGHLPTAYTCYGILLLPVYRDRAVLQERLAMALQNAQGFGFA